MADWDAEANEPPSRVLATLVVFIAVAVMSTHLGTVTYLDLPPTGRLVAVVVAVRR